MSSVIVHEWISQTGGSEKVLDQFVRIFPTADVFCLWNDTNPNRYPGREIRESWMARTSLRRRKEAALLAMPTTWRNLWNPGYEWALVSSHLFAHHVRFRHQSQDFKKFVYVHTPARYIWAPEHDSRGETLPVRAASAVLKRLDRRRAAESSTFIANSEFIRRRVSDCWDVESTVIHPPVDTAMIQATTEWRSVLTGSDLSVIEQLPNDYVLGASRFIPYKRLDLVIRAGELMGLPVVLAGSGSEEGRLRQLASSSSVPVYFALQPSDALLYALYEGARLFVFPAVEDFGIMPVEAMACGTPVVVNRIGGASEGIGAGEGGTSFDVNSETDLRCALADAVSKNRQAVAAAATRFSHSRFASEIADLVERGLKI